MIESTPAAGAEASEPVRTEDEMGFLSTNQVGAILGFQGRTVREMCRKGEIPSLEIGGEYRIERKAFRAWLESRKVPPPSPRVAEAQ